MAANDVADLLLRIDATTEGLRRELKKAEAGVDQSSGKMQKGLAKLDKSMKKLGDVAKKAGIGLAGAMAGGAAAMTKLTRDGLKQVDSLAKVSSKLGIATQELAKLRFAAEQTGASSDTLDMALQRMTRRVSEAAQGTGEARNALAELGLNAKELAASTPDEVFRKVAGAMEGVNNKSDKLRLAFKLFDSEGVALVNTLAAGTSGLDAMGAEAEKAGLAISRDMAAKVESANDAMNRVSTLTTGFSQQLAVQFAPALAAIADKLFGVGTGSTDMASMANTAFNAVIRTVGFVGDAFRGLEIIFLTLETGVRTMALVILESFDLVLRDLSSLANKIPGVSIDYEGSSFSQFIGDFRDDTFKSANSIQEKLNEELPSDKFARLAEEANAALESIPPVAGDVQRSVVDMARMSAESLDEITVTAKRVEKDMGQFAGLVEEESGAAAVAIAENTDAMTTSITRGFERMRDGVGEFFKGMLMDGNASLSGLLNMFKGVIAEMVATAATNRIMLTLGMGGAAGGAMASTGGLGSMMGGGAGGGILSALGGGVQNFGSGIYNAAGQGLFQLGRATGSESLVSASGRMFDTANNMTVGGALGGIAGGIAGGFASNAVFGETSGIGNAAGAFIGQGLIPIPLVGSAIGSFLGGGVESLIGGDNNGNNAGRANIDFGTGQSSVGGVGKSFDSESVGALQGIADWAQGIAKSLGTTMSAIDVVVGANELRVNEFTFAADQQDELVRKVFDIIVERSSDLDTDLKGLITSFEGTTEQAEAFARMVISVADEMDASSIRLVTAFRGTADQTLAYVEALGGLQVALNTDPVQAAKDQYAAVGVSLTESYSTQMESLQGLIGRYDGSLEATQRLSGELQNSKQMAFALAQQLLEASGQIESLTLSSAESIRQSILSEGQLREARKNELNALAAELEVLSDPTAIKSTVSQIEQLNRQVFESLGPEKQKAQAESFAGFIEQVNEKAQDRLSRSITELEATQGSINASIGSALDNAARSMQSAADAMMSAAGNIPRTFSFAVKVRQPDFSKLMNNIPQFASGGSASPGMAIVGEQGPELVRFNRPGHVFTASETRGMMSGDSGLKGEIADLRRETQALAIMQSKQLKLWQRVTRDGESLRTVAV